MIVRLSPPPPFRGLIVAAVLCVLGAVLAIAGGAASLPALIVVGIVVLVLGIALAGVGMLMWTRSRVEVHLDDEGYRVVSADGDRSGAWSDVVKVTQSANGARLTLHHSPDHRTVLVSPSGRADDLDELAHEIARQLDRHRGYQALPG